MSYVDFSDPVMQLIRIVMGELFADDQALKDHINRGGVAKKAFLISVTQTKIDLLQVKIDNIDSIVAQMKVQLLAELNAKKALAIVAKSDFENIDE